MPRESVFLVAANRRRALCALSTNILTIHEDVVLSQRRTSVARHKSSVFLDGCHYHINTSDVRSIDRSRFFFNVDIDLQFFSIEACNFVPKKIFKYNFAYFSAPFMDK